MRRLPVLSGLLVLLACGGGGTAPPPPPPPPPAPVVASVTVVPDAPHLIPQQTVQLAATPKDASGNPLSGHAIVWTVSPGGIAGVDATGLVTGVAAGTATVTATSDGKSGSATITVSDGGVVGISGGTVTAALGNVTLTFPAQALTATSTVTVSPVVTPPPALNLVAGTAYDLGPDGTQFAQPVTLSIKYDPARLRTGADASLLRMHLLVGSAWQAVQGSTVDVTTHTVTATTTHFSKWVICQFPCYADAAQLDLFFTTVPALLPGGTIQVAGKVSRGGGYGGPVTYTVSGGPPGLTGAIVEGSDLLTLTLTLRATPAVAPGTYHLTIRAQAATPGLGITDALVSLDVVVPVPQYSFSANPNAVSVAQGGTGSTSLTLARSAFSGGITFSAENLPAGVTAAFSPLPVTGNSSTLTFNVGAAVTPGDYTVTVRGTATGIPDVTVPVGLTVTGTVVSSFTIAPAPAFLGLTTGGTASIGITATRTGGFGGSIAYSVTGVPAGFTAIVAATAVPDSEKLTVSAAGSTPPGNYSVVVNAMSGAVTRQLTIPVAVAAAGSFAVHTDFTACHNVPLWFAVQDGTGPFVQVAVVNGVVDYSVTSNRIATAEVHGSSATGFVTAITYFTRAELQQAIVRAAGPCPGGFQPGSGKIVNGAVKGLAIIDLPGTPPLTHLDEAIFSMGGGAGNALSSGGISDHGDAGTVQIANVAGGRQDLIAFRRNRVAPGTSEDRVVVRRGLNVANGGSFGLVDFNTSEAVAPVTGSLAINGATGPVSQIMSYVSDATCAAINPMYTIFSEPAAGFPMYGVPSSLQQTGDLHQVVVYTSNQIATLRFHTMGPQSIAIWPVLTASVTSTTGAYKRLTALVPAPSDYQFASFSESGAGNTILINASANILGAGISLTIPDLSAVAGFNLAWAPGTGILNYSVGLTSNSPFGPSWCVDGGTKKSSGVSGSN